MEYACAFDAVRRLAAHHVLWAWPNYRLRFSATGLFKLQTMTDIGNACGDLDEARGPAIVPGRVDI